jgi:hypothetical protein
MARSERQEDGTRGGVGTMTKPGARPRPRQAQGPQQAPEASPAAPGPRRGRQPRPAPPQQPAVGPRDQGVPAPRAAARRVQPDGHAAGLPPVRTTGPQPAAPPARQAPAGQAARTTPGSASPLRQAGAAPALLGTRGSHRMPFVLLLCGLLGGALVSALVISTTLAEGSFQITNLQHSTSSLAKQRQTLQEEVAQARSAPTIEQRASQLGMRRTGELRFVNLKTGKVTTDGPTWSGAANAPGYAP